LLAASSACFTKAIPSVVTCWEKGKEKDKQVSKKARRTEEAKIGIDIYKREKKHKDRFNMTNLLKYTGNRI